MTINMMPDKSRVRHIPVLLNEVLSGLEVEPGGWFVDATAGRGGHTKAILESGGKVIALDQDQDAITELKLKFDQELKEERVVIKEGNFANLLSLVDKERIGKISGVLFDLGMSTQQIWGPRGFSFLKSEALDMRMSLTNEVTAAKIINNYSRNELYEIFRRLGEENLAGPIADAIFRARAIKRIETTDELVEIVVGVYHQAHVQQKIHPATRVFQALRIAVNRELENLRQGLECAWIVLRSGGRCVVISFHSLEDRIVKQFFLNKLRLGEAESVTKQPIVANRVEIKSNPAARSAKLRIAKKLKYEQDAKTLF